MPLTAWPAGDHRAACANSGALASRALPLERAVARVCQEAGARVARNMRLADINLPVPVADPRWIEIVCNGVPLWHAAQLAVDTACTNPVTRSGEPRILPLHMRSSTLCSGVRQHEKCYSRSSSLVLL